MLLGYTYEFQFALIFGSLVCNSNNIFYNINTILYVVKGFKILKSISSEIYHIYQATLYNNRIYGSA